MDDYVIRIWNSESVGHTWVMIIDLKELADSAGIRKKEKDGIYTDPRTGETEVYKGSWYTDYSMTKAKKLLKLIWQYGTDKDREACDRYLAGNAKLYKAWTDLCRV